LDEATKEAVEAAARDHVAAQLRDDFAEALAAALRTAGKTLWIWRRHDRSDRAEGKSPF
jgi:Arc/MetJ family transcription regulator